MPIQSTQLVGGKNPTKYLQQYIGSALDHVVHVSENLDLIAAIYGNLPAIDILDDYAQAIQTVATQINSNATIIQGAQGVKGDKGDQGDQGVKGDKGDKGDTGSQGQQGLQGIQGNQGNTGPAGVQGVQGVPGTTPHIDATTGNWFIGTTNTGIKAQGTNGVDGQDGVGVVWQTALATSSMLPALPYANETDAFYINDTGNAFRYDANLNTWINIGNRKGLKGDKGDQGVAGNDGVDGTDGIDGNDGAPGKSAYELWVASDPTNNNLTEAQWLATLAGGEYGEAVSNAANLAPLQAKEGQRRDVTTTTPGLILTYAYHDESPRSGISSSFTGQNGKWVDETNGVFYDSVNFSMVSNSQVGVVGSNTTALGSGVEASATNSTSIGNGSLVKTARSTSVGQGSTVRDLTGTGGDSSTIGYNNTIKGANVNALGSSNTIESSGVICVGNSNTIKANNSLVLSTRGTVNSLTTSNPIIITNDSTARNHHSEDSVLIGSNISNNSTRVTTVGKQNTGNVTLIDAVSIGTNSAPITNTDGYTGIGKGAGSFVTGDNQGVFAINDSLVFKAVIGATVPSDGSFKLNLPLSDVSNNKNDGTKVLSSNSQGYAKWVDPNTLITSTNPAWVDLTSHLVGGVFNRNALSRFEYKISGNVIVVRGSLSVTSTGVAPLSVTLATNLPTPLVQSAQHKVVAHGTSYDNPLLPPTTIVLEGSTLTVHIHKHDNVTVNAPVPPETIGVTIVTPLAVPTNYTFNFTIGA